MGAAVAQSSRDLAQELERHRVISSLDYGTECGLVAGEVSISLLEQGTKPSN